MNHDPAPTLARRTFLAAGCAACGCAMGARQNPADEPTSQPTTVPAGIVDLGPITDYPTDGVYDQHRRAPLKVLVLRTGDRLAVASSVCTHKRCTVRKGDDGELACPCHGSRFDADGTPLNGPAKIALPRHAVHVEAGRLIANLGRQFDERQWDDPAASVRV